MPTISMKPRANYVTQSSVWTNQFYGPLTNRRIAQYQKEGRLTTNSFVRAAVSIKRRISRKKSLKQTMKVFERF